MSASHHALSEFDSGNTDSVASTPRSEQHHHMYDDTTTALQPRARFMCSFGGKIILRPHDNQLRYVGGDTRIVAVNRHNTTFVSLLGKLSKLAGSSNINIKYQLPNEDLDALITVTTDEDVENMMEEYDRLVQAQKSARLRLFLFLNDQPGSARTSTMSSILDGSSKREQWFVDALNGGAGAGVGLERGRSEASSIVSEVPDYLFGLDASDEPPRESKLVKNKNILDPGSPAPPRVPSPYYSTSSTLAPTAMTVIPDLPPVKTKVDKPNVVENVVGAGEKLVQQQQQSYPGSPLWHYPGPPMQTIPVYYVPGPVQPGNIPVQPIPMRAAYPFPVPPNQLPVGYPAASNMGQVYSGMRPVMGVDPNEISASARVVTEGMNQPMYYGIRNSGVVSGYGAPVSEEMLGPGTADGKPGRVSQ